MAWHGACFDISTGDIEYAPTLSVIHSFKTTHQGLKIYVTTDPSLTTNANKSRLPALCFKGLSFPATDAGVIIVGGGSGGFTMVIALRESGYVGLDSTNIYMVLYHSAC